MLPRPHNAWTGLAGTGLAGTRLDGTGTAARADRRAAQRHATRRYVEVPPSLSKLCYCNLMCGVIRGALEMVNRVVTCEFVRQKLHGAEYDEIRLTLQEVREDQPPPSDE